MRRALAVLLIGATSACNAQPAKQAPVTTAQAVAQAVHLKASDGVTVYGRYFAVARPKAVVLLFHQAGSSKEEYATVAPRLAAAGYSALAIDQRAGGQLFGTNETAAALGRKADYLEALPDMQAALDWAEAKTLPIILWGSSYSSSLVFVLAASHPHGLKAVLSFSPGEYFESDKGMVRRAAAKVDVPVFLASANSADEKGESDPIMAALPKNPLSMRFVPEHGVHGSSTLIAARNRDGAEANWKAVMAFLDRVSAAR